ncbi:MAG: hypothetical protein AAF701_02855 [Pseudomonadota bacterium]
MNTAQKKTLLDWLGLKDKIDTTRPTWVGKTLGWFLTAVALIVIMGGVSTLFYFIMLFFSLTQVAPEQLHTAIRNVGFTVGAFFGAPFVIWRAVVA